MARSPRRWKFNLSLLADIDLYEEFVEADFQRFYHLDYRDRYRTGGGDTELTLRRLLVLVDGLPPESLFKSVLDDRPAISETSSAVMDIFEALVGEIHPRRRWREIQEEQVREAEENALRERILEEKREKARAFNQRRLELINKELPKSVPS